jgi:hypothetical protein
VTARKGNLLGTGKPPKRHGYQAYTVADAIRVHRGWKRDTDPRR